MSLINSVGKLISYELKENILHKMGAPHMFWSIRNLQKLGFEPEVIFDIGAYKGEWTERVNEIFPEATFFMFEGQKSKEAYLKLLKDKLSNRSEYIIGLLGAEQGKPIYFNESETASSVSLTNTTQHNDYLQTLNYLVKSKQIQIPNFIKIDVQGYELEVLKGASDILQNTEAILMEISLLDIGNNNTPLLNEVLIFMENLDFVPYDICSASTRRPLDNALWQTDILFIKKDSKYRLSKDYK